MKRWLIVPALILLLGGCTDKASQIPEVETMQITTPTEPALYEDTHKVETQTNGAVKVYTIADRKCVRMAAMGDHYLMLGTDTITLLKGEGLAPSVKVEVPGMNVNAVSVHDDGVAYHDKETGSVVFLNEHLREVSELVLQQTVIGDAFISDDWNNIYYCTAEGVAVLNVSTGIARMLLSYEAQWLGVTGMLQDGTVLRCAMQADEETTRIIAIRSDTGELLEEGEDIAKLLGNGKMYFFERQNGNKREYIFGSGEGQPCSFTPAEPVSVIPLPDADRVLQPIRTVYGVTLDCYQLSTGKRIASVDLPDVMTVECVGTEGSVVWLTVEGELYRWDTEKSAIEDEKVYMSYRFTRRDPD